MLPEGQCKIQKSYLLVVDWRLAFESAKHVEDLLSRYIPNHPVDRPNLLGMPRLYA